MKTKLHLHNVDFEIDLLKKNDVELIKEKVRLDFAEFTSGTSEEYEKVPLDKMGLAKCKQYMYDTVGVRFEMN